MEARERLLFPQRKLVSELHYGPLVGHKVSSVGGDPCVSFNGVRSNKKC